jgi:uncharacterized repeat protein (TIGR01451 family)
MNDATNNNVTMFQAEHLPVWWRCVLVAVSMLILCSCAQPVSRTRLTPDKSLTQPPAETQVTPVPPVVISPEVVGGGVMPMAGVMGCEPGSYDANGQVLDPYGPVVGPSDEYLCDGGDYVTPAGVHADWSITGLEQEDAISHYDTVEGRTFVVPSNRVCIYAPRFAAVRRVVQPIAHEQPVFINQTLDEQVPSKAVEAVPPIAVRQRRAVVVDEGQQPSNIFRQRQQAGGLENLQATMDAYNAVSAYANLEIIRTGEVSDAEKALVERSSEAAITWTGIQAPQVVFGVKQAHAQVGVRQAGIIYQSSEPNHPRLRLIKLASCGHAEPGEEVEFTLRYDNIGDQVIGNVTIVDNLSTRLEYVPETAKSSVDADFLTQLNDAGSLILRWEIIDPVKPGEGGVLRFRVKVR